MDVKEAIKKAKEYIKEVLTEEGVMNVGLEEIELDDSKDAWLVTLGFSRPWNSQRNALAALTGDPSNMKRAYRLITINNKDGKVISMKRRDSVE